MDVQGRTAVITGGASGIGLATAKRLAKAGARLVLGDIEEGPLDDAVANLGADGAEVIGVHCDVAKLADVEALRDAALEVFGAAHIIFNNAGVGGGPVIGAPMELWRWVHGVNLDGVVHGVHVFLPLFLEQGEGHVVNTASLAGLGGVPGMGPYLTSKFAVVGLSEGLFYELAMLESPVGVSVLAPGFVNTRIHESIRNMPGTLASWESQDDVRAVESFATAAVKAGIDPSVVADEVHDAIVSNSFWILPHRHVAVRTTELRAEWMQGARAPMIDLNAATRGN